MEDNTGNEREEIYSERVRAGKRTYFFDVKSTRGGDYYVTITESKSCLLYTSPSPRDGLLSRMPSSA